MHLHFEKDSAITPNDPTIIVKAAENTGETAAIMTYLTNYQANNSSGIIPIKTTDQIVMVKTETIILADITNNLLLIYTTNGIWQTKETLAHFNQKLPNNSFLQISKHAIINIDHLLTLEDSFSGNLTAKLTNDIKTSVSRKYVKDLMTFLGI